MSTTPCPWPLPDEGERVNLGCQIDYMDGWINTDVRPEFGDICFDLNDDWPFEDDFLDCVYASQVIEHLQSCVHFMSEAWRVLKPGGELIVLTMGPQDAFWNTPDHVRPYTRVTFELYGTLSGPYQYPEMRPFTSVEVVEEECFIGGHGLVTTVNARLVK